MALGSGPVAAGLSPVAVVWCRQVDNEAESPGYTTIPEEFPGRRETLEAIRIVGNLTINIADTHDYWDPDPAQPLSFYPNLFLYPAANGRYTCVGRMFLSTEDRPRLGMKTLVFATADLLATGEFGPAVLRAHATMGGPAKPTHPTVDPDPSVYQAVGEGFLFHRGTSDPVVVVAADQWEAGNQVVQDMVRLLPGSLLSLGAFLVFPYFLPEAKVNTHEFTEQIPLTLALMRVPKGEAQGDRHSKRIQSWELAPVSVRDLTHPPTARARESLPLVLQYARDGLESKLAEIARRVDVVESGRSVTHLHDPERQGGRDRRKEMWRIATAMETAAILLSRPKGRSVPMSGETAKRANEYVQAQPSVLLPRLEESRLSPTAPPVLDPSDPVASTVPPWLQRPTEVRVPPSASVPVSVSDDPSIRPSAPPPEIRPTGLASVAPPPAPEPDRPFPPVTGLPTARPLAPAAREPDGEALRLLESRVAALERSPAPPDPAILETKLLGTMETRLREVSDRSAQGILRLGTDLGARLAPLESRPAVDVTALSTDLEQRLRASLDAALPDLSEKVRQTVQSTGELWAQRLREELRQNLEEIKARSARSEEELRAALVAQLDLEVAESKEQVTAVREELEARVRELLKSQSDAAEQHRVREVRELEQRVAILVEGRAKDLESRLATQIADQREHLLQLADERIDDVEKRAETEREARIAEIADANSSAVAGLQVRLQAFFEQKLRENQEREREKYVELLARLKADVDQALSKTIDSNRFDTAVRERVARALESARGDQEKVVAAGLADAELRLKATQAESILRLERLETKLQQRETDLARVERSIRQEADDLDRRLLVLSDRVLPVVRKTWLKVAELEKRGPASEETESRVNELRRELVRELRRVEGELLEQTSDLRDRLEGTIAHQGRIWLNLLKQLSAETHDVLKAGPRPAARPSRPAPPPIPTDDELDAELRAAAAYRSFAESDPPNPMDPTPALGPDPSDRDLRRRVRRT